jgi:hypothetical protein
MQDVLINEGLWRWDVRYYLSVLYSRRGQQHVEVAYEVGRVSHIPSELTEHLPRICYPVFQY